jgi:hypothetical protein
MATTYYFKRSRAARLAIKLMTGKEGHEYIGQVSNYACRRPCNHHKRGCGFNEKAGEGKCFAFFGMYTMQTIWRRIKKGAEVLQDGDKPISTAKFRRILRQCSIVNEG